TGSVARNSGWKQPRMAAKRATASLGSDQEHVKEWLNDPKKLLELIAAAQGSKGAGAIGPGPGAADASQPVAGIATTGCGVGGDADGVFLGLRGAGGGQSRGDGHAAAPSEDQILKILGALTNLGRTGM